MDDVYAPPTGTLTFLFTDIEGSTKLLQELGGARTSSPGPRRRRARSWAARARGEAEAEMAESVRRLP